MSFWDSVRKKAKNVGRKLGFASKRTGFSKKYRRKAATEMMTKRERGAGTVSYKTKL